MTLEGRMTDLVEVWERTAESDTWTIAARDCPAMITLQQPGGARREFMLGTDSTVTHIARMQYSDSDTVKAGRRLRRAADSSRVIAEWEIVAVRPRAEPRPGFLVVLLVEQTATLP